MNKRLKQLFSINSHKVSEFIQDAYRIEVSKNPVRIKGGTESSVWIIQDNKDDQYILKIFGDLECPIGRVLEEGKLYRYLNKYSVNVPKVITTKDNKYAYELKYGSEKFPVMLMRFEKLHEEKPSKISDKKLSIIGGTIGKMHQVLSVYPDKKDYFRMNFPDWLIREDIKKKIEGSPSLKRIQKEDINLFINHFCNISKLKEKYSNYKNLSISILHTDLAFEHTPFLPNGEVYIFDFADRFIGPVCFELGYMFAQYFKVGTISFKRWEYITKIVLESYQTQKQLSEDDINAIPITITLRILASVRYLIELGKKMQKPMGVKGIERMLKLLRYIDKKNLLF